MMMADCIFTKIFVDRLNPALEAGCLEEFWKCLSDVSRFKSCQLCKYVVTNIVSPKHPGFFVELYILKNSKKMPIKLIGLED